MTPSILITKLDRELVTELLARYPNYTVRDIISYCTREVLPEHFCQYWIGRRYFEWAIEELAPKDELPLKGDGDAIL